LRKNDDDDTIFKNAWKTSFDQATNNIMRYLISNVSYCTWAA